MFDEGTTLTLGKEVFYEVPTKCFVKSAKFSAVSFGRQFAAMGRIQPADFLLDGVERSLPVGRTNFMNSEFLRLISLCTKNTRFLVGSELRNKALVLINHIEQD